MYLMPDEHWQWCLDKQSNRLMIRLGHLFDFQTPYHADHLVPDICNANSFTTEHANYYDFILEKLKRGVDASPAKRVQLALNATVAFYFFKNQMPRSYFFSESSTPVQSDMGQIFELVGKKSRSQVLVVAANEQISLVLLISKKMALNEQRELKQFEVFKVMNNRLHPLSQATRPIIAA